jgi:drug/metabolite transporter (DMT)-like permease
LNKHTHYQLSFAGFSITLLGAVLFSTKAIIVKLAFHSTKIDALTLLVLRMLFSLPFYLVAAWLGSRRENTIRINSRQWLYIIFLGIFGYYLSSLFDFLGLQWVSAGLERLILFLYPSFVLLINSFFFHQKISPFQKWALLLTYAGLVIAYAGELHLDSANPNFFLGSSLIFLCSITYAIYIAGSGRLVHQVGVTRFTAYAMLFSTAGVFIHFLLSGNGNGNESASKYWLYGVSLALIATVIPTFLISLGMKKIGASNVAIISSIGPVSTILQAWLVLHEKITYAQITGTALIISGILLIGWKTGKSLGQKT